jgi:hypothetical protein
MIPPRVVLGTLSSVATATTSRAGGRAFSQRDAVILDAIIPGLRVTNELNKRGKWFGRARRTKDNRVAVRRALGHVIKPTSAPLVVTLTRISPRAFDDDGLAAAFKGVRDEVAALLGRGDDPKAGIRWVYGWERGRVREYAVRIQIEHEEVKA